MLFVTNRIPIEGYRSSVSALHESGMADIWIRGVDDYEQLERAQKLRFDIYLTVALRSFEDAYFLWTQGRLDDKVWNSLLAPLVDVRSTAAFDHFWKQRRHHFRPEFADYVDAIEPGDYSYV